MLIIDRNKDYYDYIQGIYGVDPKIVFNRQSLDLCGKDVEFSCFNNLAYFLVEIATTWYLLRIEVDPDRKYAKSSYSLDRLRFCQQDIRSVSLVCTREIKQDEKLSDSVSFLLDINDAHSVYSSFISYVVKHSRKHGFGNENIDYDDMFRHLMELPVSEIMPRMVRFGLVSYKRYENPLLKCINFGGVVPPEDMFIKIQNYLSAQIKDGVESTMTDEQKITSHGFDKKLSFRKRK